MREVILRSSPALADLSFLQNLFLSFCLFLPPSLLPRFLATLIQTGSNIASSRSRRGGETGVLGVIGGKPLSSIFCIWRGVRRVSIFLFSSSILYLFSLSLETSSLFPTVRVILPSIPPFSFPLSYFLTPRAVTPIPATIKILYRSWSHADTLYPRYEFLDVLDQYSSATRVFIRPWKRTRERTRVPYLS